MTHDPGWIHHGTRSICLMLGINQVITASASMDEPASTNQMGAPTVSARSVDTASPAGKAQAMMLP